MENVRYQDNNKLSAKGKNENSDGSEKITDVLEHEASEILGESTDHENRDILRQNRFPNSAQSRGQEVSGLDLLPHRHHQFNFRKHQPRQSNLSATCLERRTFRAIR